MATANLLYIESHGEGLPKSYEGLTNDLIRRVETMNVPSVLMGIGLQAEMPLGKNDEQQRARAIKGFHFHNLSVKMLDAFASKAPRAGFTVRGNITSDLCDKAGIRACVPLGCPSLTINLEMNLGSLLKSQWIQARQRSTSPGMRIAIHLPQLERGGKFHEEFYCGSLMSLMVFLFCSPATIIPGYKSVCNNLVKLGMLPEFGFSETCQTG